MCGESLVDPVVFAVRDVVDGVPLAIGRNGRVNDLSKRDWCAPRRQYLQQFRLVRFQSSNQIGRQGILRGVDGQPPVASRQQPDAVSIAIGQ